ncbi:MAG: hypothetical protein ACKO3T_18355 [Planctomycetaceae bacterium]
MTTENSTVAGSGLHRDISLIFQVYRTTTPPAAGNYLAGPISTGRRYYLALARTRTTSLEQLIARIGQSGYWDQVRGPNVTEGELHAEKLRISGVPHVIFTGAIHIDYWSGEDYMELCFQLIETRVRRLYFHPEWMFSSGAVREYMFALEKGFETLNTDGSPLLPQQALQAMQSSCDEIENLGLSPSAQWHRTERLRSMLNQSSGHTLPQQLTHT